MTDIYNFITNVELAKNIDNLLEVLIKYYMTDYSNSFGADGVTNKMNELGYDVTKDNVQSTMNTMEWLGILSSYYDQEKRYTRKVTNLGYYIYNNEKLADRIRQNNIDAERQRDNIEAAIKTNKNVKINIWLTLTVAIITGIGTVVQSYISYQDRLDKLEKNVVNQHNSIPFKSHVQASICITPNDTPNVKSSK